MLRIMSIVLVLFCAALFTTVMLDVEGLLGIMSIVLVLIGAALFTTIILLDVEGLRANVRVWDDVLERRLLPRPVQVVPASQFAKLKTWCDEYFSYTVRATAEREAMYRSPTRLWHMPTLRFRNEADLMLFRLAHSEVLAKLPAGQPFRPVESWLHVTMMYGLVLMVLGTLTTILHALVSAIV